MCFKLWMRETLMEVVMLVSVIISEMNGKSASSVWSQFSFQVTFMRIDPYGALQVIIRLEPHFVIICK